MISDDCESGGEPVWAPDRTKFAYFTNSTLDKPKCPTEIDVFSADGTLLKRIPGLDQGNAVMRVDWLGNDRIGIDTHINPSQGQYRVVEATTGREVASYFGYSFSPSPDSRRIAHAGGMPHFAPQFAKSDYLMIDDAVVYPRALGAEPNLRPADQAESLLYRDIHEFRTELAWSPSGTQVAFIERLYDWRADQFGSYYGKEEHMRCLLVVVPASGGVLVQITLSDVPAGMVRVRWTSGTRLAVEGDGFSREYSAVQ